MSQQTMLQKIQSDLMIELTHNVTDRFITFDLDPIAHTWKIAVAKEVVEVEFIKNYPTALRVKYKKFVHASIDYMDLSIDEILFWISHKSFELIRIYREHEGVKIIDDKIVEKDTDAINYSEAAMWTLSLFREKREEEILNRTKVFAKYLREGGDAKELFSFAKDPDNLTEEENRVLNRILDELASEDKSCLETQKIKSNDKFFGSKKERVLYSTAMVYNGNGGSEIKKEE